jgi:hypothetical protein
VTPIVVRDLGTGELSSRPHDALTLDVPADFPRTGVVFTVADGFRANYTAADGQHVLRNVTPGPLRWRVKGETCLIARSGGARRLRQYRLCWVAPDETPAEREGLIQYSPE